MTAPHDPHARGDHDFRQLTGAFDRPITPSPHFTDALKKRVQAEAETQVLPTASTAPVSHRTARATSRPLPRRGWQDIAIAAAVIVGMLASTFWYAEVRIGNGDPDQPSATHYAAQPLSNPATLEPDGQTTQWNDPGNAMSFPRGFDPKHEHEVVTLENGPSSPVYAALADDTLVVSGNLPGSEDPDSQGLMAIDLASGKVLWTADLVPYGNFFTSGGRIVGVFGESGETEYSMTSIAVDSGQVVWADKPLVVYQGPDIAFAMSPHMVIRPVVFEDVVYYAEPFGEVVALDARTGTVLWNLPVGGPLPRTGPDSGVSIVGDNDYLYAVDADNTIRKIDRHSGEVIDRFDASEHDPFEYDLELHVDGDLLIVIARVSRMEGGAEFVDAFSTESGDQLWSRSVGTVGPFIAFAANGVAVPHWFWPESPEEATSEVIEPSFHVDSFDRETGQVTRLYETSDESWGTVSAAGSVVCVNHVQKITCYDMASDTPAPVTLSFRPSEGSRTPLLFWNESAIVLDVDDGVVLIRPKGMQPDASATPSGG